ALKKDPISLHLEHLGGNAKWPYDSHGGPFLDSKRIKEVILKVKKEAQWGKPLAKGSAQGFAFHFTFGGYVALITQLKIAENGKLKVEKITAAVDIGELINPSGAHEQISGGIIDGLNMTLNSLISVREGKIEQDNYHKYPMLRMEEAPNPDIFFINTQAALEGVGEMGLPPVAASVCNAIFAITGKRIRSLPVRIHDLSYS
ncbi:MAG: isoquinoline 1-oxidoreductase, partial [Bacteroidetes bacterium 4572_77]